MRNFFKSVLANIVAFFIIGFVGFLSLILIIVIASMSGQQEESANLTKNSVLTLDLKTNIIDGPAEDNVSFLNFKEQNQNVMLYDIISAIQKAKTDDNIKGISIENDQISAGITQLDDIREALEDFKKSGKFVICYGNNVSQGSYYLGSVADEYYLHPAGGIDLKGLSSEVVFLKDFADKYGVGLNVIRHGKYKAAVEPYLRNDMSPENKEQISTFLNDIWSNNSKKMASSRKIELSKFQTITDSLYAYIPDNSTKYHLANKLIQKGEYDNILRQKLGLNKDEEINKISFPAYISTIEPTLEDNKISILYASGQIFNGEGEDGIYSETFIQEIKKVANDDNIKAVVLRINSPGGSANASDEILFELTELKKKKPLIVSFGDYAASGGYYIAMAGDKIFSSPNTLTGSIGVFGILYDAKELANKNGIHTDVVKTNANSNMYSLIGGLSDGGRNIITKSVEQTYKRFVHFVTKNRNKTFEEIDAIGGGRVWSGTKAKEIGLVDELGNLNDAIKFAAQKAKLKSYEVDYFPARRSTFEKFFGSMNNKNITAQILKYKLGEDNYNLYEKIVNPKIKGGILMETPYKVSMQ